MYYCLHIDLTYLYHRLSLHLLLTFWTFNTVEIVGREYFLTLPSYQSYFLTLPSYQLQHRQNIHYADVGQRRLTLDLIESRPNCSHCFPLTFVEHSFKAMFLHKITWLLSLSLRSRYPCWCWRVEEELGPVLVSVRGENPGVSQWNL